MNYYSGDGLQGNEFTHGAYYKDEAGKIYFGGVNGITSFSPRKINTDAKELKVYITDFYVYNHPVHKNTLSDGTPIIFLRYKMLIFFNFHIATIHSVLLSQPYSIIILNR